MTLNCSLRYKEGVTDFDERYNPRFAEDVAKNADGIDKLNLFNFKVDKKTGSRRRCLTMPHMLTTWVTW